MKPSFSPKFVYSALMLGLLSPLGLAQAQDFPAKTVELILPYAAGGGVDAMARAFAREASDMTGQQFIVNNRPGGGGTIGFAVLANAKPDGYTMVFSPSSAMTNAPFLIKKMAFRNDQIEPVCQVFENVFSVAVKDDSPIKTLDELVAKAKAAPGTLSYGHAGPGSVPHLATANLAKSSGVSFNEIAFRGDAQVIPQLLGGHIDFGALGVSSVVGKDLRILAVYGDKRLPGLPDVPAITEFGIKHAVIARNGLYVSRNVPQAARDKLQQACHAATDKGEFQKAAGQLYQQVNYLDSATFAARLASDNETNRSLIQSLGLLKTGN